MTKIAITVDTSTRQAARENLVNIFLKEAPGTADNTSKYIYVVEDLPHNDSIYLKRPAIFNFGFDFTVNVENTLFTSSKVSKGKTITRTTHQPSHGHIITDIQSKIIESKSKSEQLKSWIDTIYNCGEPAWNTVDPNFFSSGFNTHVILKCIKWLFIEQDITYWNFSGRAMLYRKLSSIF